MDIKAWHKPPAPPLSFQTILGGTFLVLLLIGTTAAMLLTRLNQDIRQQADVMDPYATTGTTTSSGGTQVASVVAPGDPNFQNTNVNELIYIGGFGWVTPEKAVEFYGAEAASSCGVNEAGGLCSNGPACAAVACTTSNVSIQTWATLEPQADPSQYDVYNCLQNDWDCVQREFTSQVNEGKEPNVTIGQQGGVGIVQTITSEQQLVLALPDELLTTEQEQLLHQIAAGAQATALNNAVDANSQALATANTGLLSGSLTLEQAQATYQEYCTGAKAQYTRISDCQTLDSTIQNKLATAAQATALTNKVNENNAAVASSIETFLSQPITDASIAIANASYDTYCTGNNQQLTNPGLCKDLSESIGSYAQANALTNRVNEQNAEVTSAITALQTTTITPLSLEEAKADFTTYCTGNNQQMTNPTLCQQLNTTISRSDQALALDAAVKKNNALLTQQTAELTSGTISYQEANQTYTTLCTGNNTNLTTPKLCNQLSKTVDLHRESERTSLILTQTIQEDRAEGLPLETLQIVYDSTCNQDLLASAQADCDAFATTIEQKKDQLASVIRQDASQAFDELIATAPMIDPNLPDSPDGGSDPNFPIGPRLPNGSFSGLSGSSSPTLALLGDIPLFSSVLTQATAEQASTEQPTAVSLVSIQPSSSAPLAAVSSLLGGFALPTLPIAVTTTSTQSTLIGPLLEEDMPDEFSGPLVALQNSLNAVTSTVFGIEFISHDQMELEQLGRDLADIKADQVTITQGCKDGSQVDLFCLAESKDELLALAAAEVETEGRFCELNGHADCPDMLAEYETEVVTNITTQYAFINLAAPLIGEQSLATAEPCSLLHLGCVVETAITVGQLQVEIDEFIDEECGNNQECIDQFRGLETQIRTDTENQIATNLAAQTQEYNAQLELQNELLLVLDEGLEQKLDLYRTCPEDDFNCAARLQHEIANINANIDADVGLICEGDETCLAQAEELEIVVRDVANTEGLFSIYQGDIADLYVTIAVMQEGQADCYATNSFEYCEAQADDILILEAEIQEILDKCADLAYLTDPSICPDTAASIKDETNQAVTAYFDNVEAVEAAAGSILDLEVAYRSCATLTCREEVYEQLEDAYGTYEALRDQHGAILSVQFEQLDTIITDFQTELENSFYSLEFAHLMDEIAAADLGINEADLYAEIRDDIISFDTTTVFDTTGNLHDFYMTDGQEFLKYDVKPEGIYETSPEGFVYFYPAGTTTYESIIDQITAAYGNSGYGGPVAIVQGTAEFPGTTGQLVMQELWFEGNTEVPISAIMEKAENEGYNQYELQALEDYLYGVTGASGIDDRVDLAKGRDSVDEALAFVGEGDDILEVLGNSLGAVVTATALYTTGLDGTAYVASTLNTSRDKLETAAIFAVISTVSASHGDLDLALDAGLYAGGNAFSAIGTGATVTPVTDIILNSIYHFNFTGSALTVAADSNLSTAERLGATVLAASGPAPAEFIFGSDVGQLVANSFYTLEAESGVLATDFYGNNTTSAEVYRDAAKAAGTAAFLQGDNLGEIIINDLLTLTNTAVSLYGVGNAIAQPVTISFLPTSQITNEFGEEVLQSVATNYGQQVGGTIDELTGLNGGAYSFADTFGNIAGVATETYGDAYQVNDAVANLYGFWSFDTDTDVAANLNTSHQTALNQVTAVDTQAIPSVAQAIDTTSQNLAAAALGDVVLDSIVQMPTIENIDVSSSLSPIAPVSNVNPSAVELFASIDTDADTDTTTALPAPAKPLPDTPVVPTTSTHTNAPSTGLFSSLTDSITQALSLLTNTLGTSLSGQSPSLATSTSTGDSTVASGFSTQTTALTQPTLLGQTAQEYYATLETDLAPVAYVAPAPEIESEIEFFYSDVIVQAAHTQVTTTEHDLLTQLEMTIAPVPPVSSQPTLPAIQTAQLADATQQLNTEPIVKPIAEPITQPLSEPITSTILDDIKPETPTSDRPTLPEPRPLLPDQTPQEYYANLEVNLAPTTQVAYHPEIIPDIELVFTEDTNNDPFAARPDMDTALDGNQGAFDPNANQQIKPDDTNLDTPATIATTPDGVDTISAPDVTQTGPDTTQAVADTSQPTTPATKTPPTAEVKPDATQVLPTDQTPTELPQVTTPFETPVTPTETDPIAQTVASVRQTGAQAARTTGAIASLIPLRIQSPITRNAAGNRTVQLPIRLGQAFEPEVNQGVSEAVDTSLLTEDSGTVADGIYVGILRTPILGRGVKLVQLGLAKASLTINQRVFQVDYGKAWATLVGRPTQITITADNIETYRARLPHIAEGDIIIITPRRFGVDRLLGGRGGNFGLAGGIRVDSDAGVIRLQLLPPTNQQLTTDGTALDTASQIPQFTLTTEAGTEIGSTEILATIIAEQMNELRTRIHNGTVSWHLPGESFVIMIRSQNGGGQLVRLRWDQLSAEDVTIALTSGTTTQSLSPQLIETLDTIATRDVRLADTPITRDMLLRYAPPTTIPELTLRLNEANAEYYARVDRLVADLNQTLSSFALEVTPETEVTAIVDNPLANNFSNLLLTSSVVTVVTNQDTGDFDSFTYASRFAHSGIDGRHAQALTRATLAGLVTDFTARFETDTVYLAAPRLGANTPDSQVLHTQLNLQQARILNAKIRFLREQIELNGGNPSSVNLHSILIMALTHYYADADSNYSWQLRLRNNEVIPAWSVDLLSVPLENMAAMTQAMANEHHRANDRFDRDGNLISDPNRPHSLVPMASNWGTGPLRNFFKFVSNFLGFRALRMTSNVPFMVSELRGDYLSFYGAHSSDNRTGSIASSTHPDGTIDLNLTKLDGFADLDADTAAELTYFFSSGEALEALLTDYIDQVSAQIPLSPLQATIQNPGQFTPGDILPMYNAETMTVEMKMLPEDADPQKTILEIDGTPYVILPDAITVIDAAAAGEISPQRAVSMIRTISLTYTYLSERGYQLQGIVIVRDLWALDAEQLWVSAKAFHEGYVDYNLARGIKAIPRQAKSNREDTAMRSIIDPTFAPDGNTGLTMIEDLLNPNLDELSPETQEVNRQSAENTSLIVQILYEQGFFDDKLTDGSGAEDFLKLDGEAIFEVNDLLFSVWSNSNGVDAHGNVRNPLFTDNRSYQNFRDIANGGEPSEGVDEFVRKYRIYIKQNPERFGELVHDIYQDADLDSNGTISLEEILALDNDQTMIIASYQAKQELLKDDVMMRRILATLALQHQLP